jgi:hypothetical protein
MLTNRETYTYCSTRKSAGSENQAMIYTAGGGIAQALAAPPTSKSLLLARGTPLLLNTGGDRAGIVRLMKTNSVLASVTLLKPGPSLLSAALPDGRLVIVERTAAMIHFVDVDRGSSVPFSPRTADLKWLSSLAPGDSLRNIAFSSVATSRRWASLRVDRPLQAGPGRSDHVLSYER